MSSTAQCKSLLIEYCNKNAITDINWKRTKKYKNGNKILRDFINTTGNTITIEENENGELLILENTINLNPSELTPSQSTQTLEKLHLELIRLFVENADTLEDFAWENVISDYNNVAILDEVQALEKLYIKEKNDDILKKILSFIDDKNGLAHNLTYGLVFQDKKVRNNTQHYVKDIHPDTVNVLYDFENIEASFEKNKNNYIIVFHFGGDWEYPVFAYVYWSEKKKRLVGVFPPANENSYNVKTMTAYGSETESKLAPKNGFSELEKEKFQESAEKLHEKFEQLTKKLIKLAFKNLDETLTSDFSINKPN